MDPAPTPQPQPEVPEVLLPQQPLSSFTQPVDPSLYIRTYAKDVASIKNTPPTEEQVHSEEIKPKSSTIDSVAEMMRKAHEEQTQLPGAPIDIEQVSDAYPAAPLEEYADPKENLVVESEPEQEAIVTEFPLEAYPPKSEAVHRDAILERLRARLRGDSTNELVETPAPPEKLPTVLPPELLPAPLPVQIPAPEPLPEKPEVKEPEVSNYALPPAPPVQISQYLQTSLPEPKKEEAPAPELERLHTYSSDFANRIDQQGSSTFSVLAANSDAQKTSTVAPPRRSRVVPLVAGLAMLLIGIGAIAGAYSLVHKGSQVPTVAGVPSIITFDSSVQVQGSGTELMKNIANVSQGNTSGNVVVTYVTNATSTASGVAQPGGVLIEKLNLGAPDILTRNIAMESTVGTIHAGAESRPFLILRVTSYERTFAGMLTWESILPQDVSIFYPPYASIPAQEGTTSTSSTSPASTVLSSQPTTFVDDVVSNYNVRVLRDAYGRSIVLYGYKDKNTLIIARDEAAFTALVARLTSSGD